VFINLAEMYLAFDRDGDSIQILRDGLDAAPASGVLHYALGLALIRLKRSGDALGQFERASELEPGNARFAYAYGLALQSAGRVAAAKAALEKALAAHPDDPNVRAALAGFTKDHQN